MYIDKPEVLTTIRLTELKGGFYLNYLHNIQEVRVS